MAKVLCMPLLLTIEGVHYLGGFMCNSIVKVARQSDWFWNAAWLMLMSAFILFVASATPATGSNFWISPNAGTNLIFGPFAVLSPLSASLTMSPSGILTPVYVKPLTIPSLPQPQQPLVASFTVHCDTSSGLDTCSSASELTVTSIIMISKVGGAMSLSGFTYRWDNTGTTTGRPSGGIDLTDTLRVGATLSPDGYISPGIYTDGMLQVTVAYTH